MPRVHRTGDRHRDHRRDTGDPRTRVYRTGDRGRDLRRDAGEPRQEGGRAGDCRDVALVRGRPRGRAPAHSVRADARASSAPAVVDRKKSKQGRRRLGGRWRGRERRKRGRRCGY